MKFSIIWRGPIFVGCEEVWIISSIRFGVFFYFLNYAMHSNLQGNHMWVKNIILARADMFKT